MQIVIMRHGATTANEAHLYAGSTDVPLTERGESQALAAGVCEHVGVVYTSPLSRARRTAELCFPHAEQVVVDGLQEMDFGAFEGRSAADMEADAEYRAWVDSMCASRCPGGEKRDELSARVASAVVQVVNAACTRGDERAVIVGHGGTVMAAMDAFAESDRAYFEWQVGNCEGYVADVEGEGRDIRFVNWARFYDLEFLRGSDAACAPGQSFFQNLSCPYFPCHKGVDEREFNCLFCYCPLYALGPDCGGDFAYTEKGYKNCTGCTVPHVRDTGATLVKQRFGQLAELAKQKP